jgi:hypothetical protein
MANKANLAKDTRAELLAALESIGVTGDYFCDRQRERWIGLLDKNFDRFHDQDPESFANKPTSS